MWPLGFSWTERHLELIINPDGKREWTRVHGGPFYFNPRALVRLCAVLNRLSGWFRRKNIKAVYIYFGFRPTAPWSPGYGNEGPWWWSPVARWLKKKGWGNFGVALRRAK